MIFYKPLTDIESIKTEYADFNFDDCIYGAYIGIDEDGKNVGKCLMKVNGYNCYILKLDCDFSDKLLVEGFLRAALNFCANRNAYMAHCEILEIRDVLSYLGFENNNGVYSGDIPTLLKGSCCK
jgi:hypothetical protein